MATSPRGRSPSSSARRCARRSSRCAERSRHEHPIDTTTEIRPFSVEISQKQIDNLRRRIEATRWPTYELVHYASQGIQLAFRQELARYWAQDYDFGRLREWLNLLPQYKTKFDGLDIHFIHLRSRTRTPYP